MSKGKWVTPTELSNADYHAMAGISSSNIKQLLKSPAHYQHNNQFQTEPTAAMKLGTITHTAVFEPDRYVKEVKAAPACDRRTKAGKEAYNAFMEGCPAGCEIIPEQDAVLVNAMAASVRSAVDLRGCEAEMSGLLELDDYPGVLAKIRPDAMKGSIMYDLKTCEDASRPAAMYAIKKYGYHISATWYQDVAYALDRDIDQFVWIFVEKRPPYAVALYSMGSGMMATAREKIVIALERYQECKQADHWPGYPDEVQELDFA